MVNRERNVQIKLYVTENEKSQLQSKMSQAGYTNFSAYARKMLLDGHVNKVDFADLKRLIHEMGSLNRNLHQIYYAAEKTKNLRQEDYWDVVKEWEKAKSLINRYLYKIIRTDGDAYTPIGAGEAEEDVNGGHEDPCD